MGKALTDLIIVLFLDLFAFYHNLLILFQQLLFINEVGPHTHFVRKLMNRGLWLIERWRSGRSHLATKGV